MSLRRAAVDILIYEISDEKRPWTLREGALFDPLVSYLVSRACGDDRAWCAGYLDGGERPTLPWRQYATIPIPVSSRHCARPRVAGGLWLDAEERPRAFKPEGYGRE